MTDAGDHYDSYYAQRLWQLLPGVYRARDSGTPGVPGPLQELIARIGAQAAVVRRSIDRLWADQAIETCDDWVIPYLGDLLDVNLVNGLDARGQRLDVAKTIHYRRRKGTLAILEEIARDVTGWDAHVVEAFRRLSRTRHGLDPPVGTGPLVAALGAGAPATATGPAAGELLAREGLLGVLSGTPAGGLADLRSPHAGLLAGSAFDEFAHTADFRAGTGAVGRYGIPKLLVFLWRLQSFPVQNGTPVAVSGCPDEFVFDPTGRRVPLFMSPLPPEPDDFADTWTSQAEWQVPGPLTQSLLQALQDPGTSPPPPPHAPYPGLPSVPSFSGATSGTPPEPVTIEVWPEVGQFRATGPTLPPPVPDLVSYQYGFPAMIGAGPYDRTLLGDPPAVLAPETDVRGGGGLGAALSGLSGQGTVRIVDSQTYAGAITAATPVTALLVQAGAGERPVIRLPAPAAPGDPPAAWTFTGGGEEATLTLDGLLVSGGDIILRGAFASVRLTGFTADPGTAGEGGAGFATSVDGRTLAPTSIWIEAGPASAGSVGELLIDHCVLGPVRTRSGGAVDSTSISDSVIQGLAPQPPAGQALTTADVYDPELLAAALKSSSPLSVWLLQELPPAAQSAVGDYAGGILPDASLTALIDGLNTLVTGTKNIYDAQAFAGVPLDPGVQALLAEGTAADLATLNRALLQAAFPVALRPAALALSAGQVGLTRTTVIGDALIHRLQASDSILTGFTLVEDTQDGCVRFSAVSAGSFTPRRYLSALTTPGAPLFTSTAFGEPGYAQLLETADGAIVSAPAGVTITAGADSGSEMGAYSGLLAAVRENGLLIKYAEYMPMGLTPVTIHVT
jgi:hypothetical protein